MKTIFILLFLALLIIISSSACQRIRERQAIDRLNQEIEEYNDNMHERWRISSCIKNCGGMSHLDQECVDTCEEVCPDYQCAQNYTHHTWGQGTYATPTESTPKISGTCKRQEQQGMIVRCVEW